MFVNRATGIMIEVFTNGTGDQHSNPGRVIPKTKKILHYASFLNTQVNTLTVEHTDCTSAEG